MTIEQAAERVDMSVSMIGNVERGIRVPSVETIVRLCKIYHVSADIILDV